MTRWLAVLLTIGSVIWVAAVVLAPLAIAEGFPGASLVYQVASLICHQKPERSFHVGVAVMPVCGRCFGLYASGALAAMAAWLVAPSRISTDASRLMLGVAAVPTALSVGLEWLGVSSSSLVRAVAALPLGAAIAWVFVVALRSDAVAPGAHDQMRYHA